MEPDGVYEDERVFASIHEQKRLVCVEVPGEQDPGVMLFQS